MHVPCLNLPRTCPLDLQVVIERIRLLLEAKLGSVANSARKLKQIFADMDENGDGRISHSEFKGAMVELKVSWVWLLPDVVIVD